MQQDIEKQVFAALAHAYARRAPVYVWPVYLPHQPAPVAGRAHAASQRGAAVCMRVVRASFREHQQSEQTPSYTYGGQETRGMNF